LKQTLTFIQDKIKRSPELYKKEFATHFETFKASLATFKNNPGKRCEEIINYMLFFSHVRKFMFNHSDITCIQGSDR